MPFTKSQRRTKNDIPTENNCRPSTYFEEEYLFEKKKSNTLCCQPVTNTKGSEIHNNIVFCCSH